jgi:hypothetical protein
VTVANPRRRAIKNDSRLDFEARPANRRDIEWQRIGDQIKAASIFARSDFVNVRFSAKQDLGYQV